MRREINRHALSGSRGNSLCTFSSVAYSGEETVGCHSLISQPVLSPLLFYRLDVEQAKNFSKRVNIASGIGICVESSLLIANLFITILNLLDSFPETVVFQLKLLDSLTSFLLFSISAFQSKHLKCYTNIR